MSRTGCGVHMANISGLKSHQTRGRMGGKGTGSVLLDGGLGGQSSYASLDDYIATTGRNPNVMGMGMTKAPSVPSTFRKEAMNKKIESMMLQPAKLKNIKFSL